MSTSTIEDAVDPEIASWARRYGRFAKIERAVPAPGGAWLVLVRDHPSTCLCDRERGVRDAGTMAALVRNDRERGVQATRLFEHEDGRSRALAAGPRGLAIAESARVRIWPVSGEGAPREVQLGGYPSIQRVAWTSSGGLLLVGIRTVIVLDADLGERARWDFDENLGDAALGPDDTLALATYDMQLRSTVRLVDLDGRTRAALALDDYASDVRWDGALEVTTADETIRIGVRSR